MKSIVVLVAVIAQFICMIVAAAKYDLEAGLIVLCAIFANCIQIALFEKK